MQEVEFGILRKIRTIFIRYECRELFDLRISRCFDHGDRMTSVANTSPIELCPRLTKRVPRLVETCGEDHQLTWLAEGVHFESFVSVTVAEAVSKNPR